MIFYANSLNQIKARHNNVRPHSGSTPCADPNGGGGEGSRGPLLKYHKNIVSLAIGPDP